MVRWPLQRDALGVPMNDPETMDTDPEGLVHLWGNLLAVHGLSLAEPDYYF